MFISKSSYDAGDIVTFKLANGDEIVAKLLEDSGMEFKLERPCTVVPSQKGIMMIASLFTTSPDINITINKSHVLFHAPSAKEVQDYYIQTTTGIKPVSASVLAGV